MTLLAKILRWRCKRGHDWFPNIQSEFVPTEDICMRCRERRHNTPWGVCLCGHAWEDHTEGKCPTGVGGWR